MTRKFAILAALCILALAATSCRERPKSNNTTTSGSTTMICDNTFQNIMEQEISVFEFQYPEAHILARYEPQGAALDSLLSLNTKTIVIPRDLTEQERKFLKSKKRVPRSTKIAVDAVAFIVNPENPVEMLTLKELADIVSGKVTEWNEVIPTDRLKKISVVVDDPASSLVTYMRDSLLNGGKLGDNVFVNKSIEGVFEAVRGNRNAIGVLGVTWITSDMRKADMSTKEFAESMLSDDVVIGSNFSEDVKVLAIFNEKDATAYKPYQQNIFDGTYPLFRQIYMITTGYSGSLAGGFYSFVTGVTGQKIILKSGILPSKVQTIQVVELVN